MKALRRFQTYSRQDVQQIFDPDYSFATGAGRWGLTGIVAIPDREDDYVFFVTFGREQGDHAFDEAVTEDGVLYWQSQPSQRLDQPQIRSLIDHDELTNSIYLFLRTNTKDDYTYLGSLRYLTHDTEREKPVYFQWQILDWEIQQDVFSRMGLSLIKSGTSNESDHALQGALQKSDPPQRTQSSGRATADYRRPVQPDYAQREASQRSIGLAGEQLVVEYEKRSLVEAGRVDLADKVVHVSLVEGDGAGYDVRSYTPDEEVRYIEVKTTEGGINSSFFVSSNELAKSEQLADQYYVYRVYDLKRNMEDGSSSGRFYVRKGRIEDWFHLTPTQFRASS